MGALVALARAGLIAARAAVGGARGGVPLVAGVGTGLALSGGIGIPGVDLFPGFGGGQPRRRRRRRMLTASDLRDAAAIEGIAGKQTAARAILIRIATS